MSRDLRKYIKDTNTQIIIGAFVLLFVVGLGLIWAIYGFGAAVSGFLCLLGALVPIGLIFIALYGIDWIVKYGNRDN
ncbi:MAG: hypothetical protein UZ14_CFX002000297 [Chloroflexi bacterium OLB14]|nr:MAG: hypothetical protein UZ14_CFX002000297 [Chloroflexi bacterium OLB14]